MTHAIRAELLKFFSTRLWWGMAIGILVAGAVFATFFGFLYTSDALTPSAGAGQAIPTPSADQVANSVYTGGISVGYLLTLTIGVLQIGAEYRHKTITSTFLATPKRVQAMLAKVVALLAIGAIYAVISMVSSVAVGATVLSLRGHDPFPSMEVARTLALSLLVLGLWALIGLGVGILIPNQVAALLIGIGVAWIVEPIIVVGIGFWAWGRDHLVAYFPTQATTAIINTAASSPHDNRLSWWAASLVLAGYAALLSGIGIWRVSRQDVT